MNEIDRAKIYEINCAEKNWMFRLGELGRSANKVTVKDFNQNCANNAFVKAIALHHNLLFYSQDNNLVFEKRPS